MQQLCHYTGHKDNATDNDIDNYVDNDIDTDITATSSLYRTRYHNETPNQRYEWDFLVVFACAACFLFLCDCPSFHLREILLENSED